MLFKKVIERLVSEKSANTSRDLLFMCIIAIITCLIQGNYEQIIPIAIAFIIFLTIYIVIIRTLVKANLPFQERFKNENKAKSKIVELLRGTKKSMDILSKVGTTIFDLFDEYVTLLQKNVKTTVILIDPTDEQLLKLINKMFFQAESPFPYGEKLENLIENIIKKLTRYFKRKVITEEEYNKLIILLDTARKDGYKTLIEASTFMWETALKRANEKVASMGNNYTLTLNTLEIYYCSSLPDIKAWISDKDKALIGNYDALNIGRDNPIDFYNPRKKDSLEYYHFQNFLKVWDYKIDSSYSKKVFPKDEI
ncbi:MAG: hypothetical protein FWF63_07570 [Fibromonadales bacterium]|nr:hypothetical protein [Fibromonadales bacterium]